MKNFVPMCARVRQTHPPSKNRVWGFRTPARSRIRKTASQVAKAHQENEFTLTIFVSGVRYYGYRFYSPELGRWLSRDPMNELGAKAAARRVSAVDRLETPYSFVVNRPTDAVDFLGLDTLLIIIGDEYRDHTAVFQTAGSTAEQAYRSSKYYDKNYDAVVKVDLTGTGNGAFSLVQRAFSQARAIRTILYYGHGGAYYLFLTGTQGAGSNLADTGVPGGWKFSPLSSLSRENVTSHAFAGLYSCHAGIGIARSFAGYFGIPVEASESYVNYEDDGTPFVRWFRVPFSSGFTWSGGKPIGRNEVRRDGCWSEEAARKAGF